ncbi:hypothetical protein SAMN02787142_3675 [Burkholderia sp. WP9]|nr:hypothetical protein SAMN02787142_3675 [Burkholderia sp. WP9]
MLEETELGPVMSPKKRLIIGQKSVALSQAGGLEVTRSERQCRADKRVSTP